MSAEEFSRILTRKQATFLCISDLIENYLGSQSNSLEYPYQLVQAPYTFLAIRKVKKYSLKRQDAKIYKQAVLDFASYQDKPGQMAKDKQHLILSLTPSGTEEEKSYKSLSSTPCGSLHSVRSRSQANLAQSGCTDAASRNGNRAKQSPSVSPRHRKKASSSERVLGNSSRPNNQNAFSGIPGDDRFFGPNGEGFASQIDASNKQSNFKNTHHQLTNDQAIGSPVLPPKVNGVPNGSFVIGASPSRFHKPPRPSRLTETDSPSRKPGELTQNPTYQSLSSHPNYGHTYVASPSRNYPGNQPWNPSDDEEDHLELQTNSRSNFSRMRTELKSPVTNGHNDWGRKSEQSSSKKHQNLPVPEHGVSSPGDLANESGHSAQSYHLMSSHSGDPSPRSHINPSTQQQQQQQGILTSAKPKQTLPSNSNLETSKNELTQRISLLFGKIGSSAFELLDEHKDSLGECVDNEYTMASLFEHKNGSIFFHGIVDTIFWNSSSKTMSLVEFQTTVKATPSPYHLLQLHCLKEIADKKKICKRTKLYVLGLHLESDGPRLKLWRYKPSGAMPSIKSLLFDQNSQTQERLYACPEFNFMGRLLNKQGKEVVYEMV